MKKLFAALMLILILSGCAPEAETTTSGTQSEDKTNTSSLTHETSTDISESDEGVIEITEKMFVAQTNEIYLNYEDYLGKTFSYEGLFLTSENEGDTYYYVVRYGPGCCGYDSAAGFEVIWDGDRPEEKDWVHAVGVLELYEENGNEFLTLRLSTLEVMEERGAEYVTQ